MWKMRPQCGLKLPFKRWGDFLTQMINRIFFLSIIGPARSTIMFSAPWDGITRSTDEHHFINCAALLGKMVLNVRHTEVLLLSKQTLPVSQKYLKCFNQHFCLHFPFLTNLNSSFLSLSFATLAHIVPRAVLRRLQEAWGRRRGWVGRHTLQRGGGCSKVRWSLGSWYYFYILVILSRVLAT